MTGSTHGKQKPMIIESTCHGVQHRTNAPRMMVMVRRALRALFSFLLVLGSVVVDAPPGAAVSASRLHRRVCDRRRSALTNANGLRRCSVTDLRAADDRRR